jgi:preprotein translocase subunit SecG
MTTPAPAPVADGKTLGIVGLVLAFLIPLAGLIVSIIAKNQSKAAGVENTPAKVGVILSIVFLVLGLIIGIIYAIAAAALVGSGAVYTY